MTDGQEGLGQLQVTDQDTSTGKLWKTESQWTVDVVPQPTPALHKPGGSRDIVPWNPLVPAKHPAGHLQSTRLPLKEGGGAGEIAQ